MSRVVILDIDGTLISESLKPRPLLRWFLSELFSRYRVGIWTAACTEHAAAIVQKFFTPEQQAQLICCWDGRRCTIRHEIVPDAGFTTQRISLKRLKHLARHLKVSLDHILIVDDTPHTYRENYGNAIRIETFEDDPEDCEFERVLERIDHLHTLPSVRIRLPTY